MSDIVLLSGSPAVHSGSARLLDVSKSILDKKGYTTTKISITDMPLEDLFYGRSMSPAFTDFFKNVGRAKGIIISTPVYKASYPGVLKLLFDICPMDVFKGKTVLPIMTGGTPVHLLALEYALKPLISLLKGNTLDGVYVTDDQLDKQKENPIIDQEISKRIQVQVAELCELIQHKVINQHHG